jgi:hypothetical protein
VIRFEETSYTATTHPGRMGERWQVSAARACIPTLHTAASMLRLAWRKPDRCGVWPATMGLAPGAAATWELAARGCVARSGGP